MEIGLREWLIVGAIIVILLIVVDGWRRMRAQSNSLKIDIDDKLADLGDDNYNPELPLGTARVFKPQDGDDAQGVEQPSDAQPAVVQKSSVHETVRQENIAHEKSVEKDQKHSKAAITQPIPEVSTQMTADVDDALMAPAVNSSQSSETPSVKDTITATVSNSLSSSHTSVISENSVQDEFNENLDDEIVSGPRVASPKPTPEIDQPSTQPASVVHNQGITNDIGFSAFDSDKPVSQESISVEPEHVEESIETQTVAATTDIDAFTVPDILKKQSSTITDDGVSETLAEQNELAVSKEPLLNEAVQTDSDENAALERASSAEQIVSDLTAQLDTDLNTNLAAATDNTDSIVNNLLNTRALSKQDVSVEIEEEPSQQNYNNDEIPTESVLRRQEAVEAQAPSRSQINLGPDKFEKLLAEREKDGFLPEPVRSLDTQSDSNSVEADELVTSHEDEHHANELHESDFDMNEHHLDEDDELAHNLMPNPFQRQPKASDEVANNDEMDGYQEEQVSEPESTEQLAESQHETLDAQSEIEALKARLKALAPDEYDALEEGGSTAPQVVVSENLEHTADISVSDSGNKAENLEVVPQRSENFDQIIADLDKQIEDQAAAKHSSDDSPVNQLPEVTSVEISPVEVTTVIDDDVNLEDLDDNISHLSEVESIDQGIDSSAEISDSQPDTQSSSQIDSNDSPFAQQQDIDPFADPLMDGFKDEGSANDLMAQFEHDLQLDQQAVSNELDRPISEILRTQKAQPITQESESEQTDEAAEDALLASAHDNSLSESLLLGENFDDQDESDFDEHNLAQDAHAELEDDGIDHANDLGFSAFEQDVVAPAASNLNDQEIDDPLMAGFNEPEAYVQQESQQDDIEEQIAQKSLFNENDLEAVSAAVTPSKSAKKPRKAIANVDDPNVVLIVTVVAKDQYLNGAALRRVVEACGMEFGDMAVFHRFEDGADQGAVQFSMANAINPGVFDIENMDDTSTPGVSFFMSMDEPLDPKNALECMMATAETVATHLNGDLLDDDRSVLRPQTKEHYRERVRIHEMNKLRQRAL